jgi:hypothetical protein
MSNFDLTRFATKRGKHGEYIIKNGKRYREREGQLIEVETIETKADAKAAAAKAKRDQRHVGFPWAYLVDVCRLPEGRATLIVAIYIYRRVQVCKNRTVTLPGADLIRLGIDRDRKSRGLKQLARAGIIRIKANTPGHTAVVTLLWKE